MPITDRKNVFSGIPGIASTRQIPSKPRPSAFTEATLPASVLKRNQRIGGGEGRTGGGMSGGVADRARDLARHTMSDGPRGSMSQFSNAQLDWVTNTYGNNYVRAATALIGLAIPGAPIGSVMTVANWLAKKEKNKRGGRDQSDYNNREWGSFDGADFGGEFDSAGYRDMMNGGRSGVVTSYDVGNFDATPGVTPGGQRIYRPKPK